MNLLADSYLLAKPLKHISLTFQIINMDLGTTLALVIGVIAIIVSLYAIIDARRTNKKTNEMLGELKTTALQISNGVSSVYMTQTRFAVDLQRFNSGAINTVPEAQRIQTEIRTEASQNDDAIGKALGIAVVAGIGLFILYLLGKKK